MIFQDQYSTYDIVDSKKDLAGDFLIIDIKCQHLSLGTPESLNKAFFYSSF